MFRLILSIILCSGILGVTILKRMKEDLHKLPMVTKTANAELRFKPSCIALKHPHVPKSQDHFFVVGRAAGV